MLFIKQSSGNYHMSTRPTLLSTAINSLVKTNEDDINEKKKRVILSIQELNKSIKEHEDTHDRLIVQLATAKKRKTLQAYSSGEKK